MVQGALSEMSLEEMAETLPAIKPDELLAGLTQYVKRETGMSFGAVIKISGRALEENDAYSLEAVCGSLVFMQQLLGAVNSGILVVHGAGLQLDEAITESGLTNRKTNGLRYTDDTIYGVVEKEMQSLNSRVIGLLKAYGARVAPVPIGIVFAQGIGQEYGGRVGKPTGLNHELLLKLLSSNNDTIMPVATSIGIDGNSVGYNINADDVAATLVAVLKPKLLMYVTQTGGVLADVNDGNSVLHQLTTEQAIGLSKDGMLGKVEAVKTALQASPHTKVIITSPKDMVYSLFRTSGTEIYAAKQA